MVSLFKIGFQPLIMVLLTELPLADEILPDIPWDVNMK